MLSVFGVQRMRMRNHMVLEAKRRIVVQRFGFINAICCMLWCCSQIHILLAVSQSHTYKYCFGSYHIFPLKIREIVYFNHLPDPVQMREIGYLFRGT